MQIFREKRLLRDYINGSDQKRASIGFVPTMGALHEGHLSLVHKSQEQNDLTVVSIFVNPTQFDNPEDLAKYPSTIDLDISKLKDINCDILYLPTVEDVYEDQTISEAFNFGGIELEMEGAFRPGHFNGVGTVVKKLFCIVQPSRAYFGEKDFQQLQIIRKLVDIENLDIEIIGCPISREKNGLAMSSRNERLSLDERQEAGFIYTVLLAVKDAYENKSIEELQNWVYQKFQEHQRISLEYFYIADQNSLKTISRKEDSDSVRAFIAVHLNSVRLIDNLGLN